MGPGSAAPPALPAALPGDNRKRSSLHGGTKHRPQRTHAAPYQPAAAPQSLPMGILKLAEVIKEAAPEAVSRASLQHYQGRIVAIDTSISIYQFLTGMPQINNRNGENLSLLQGLFFRTITLLENDIKPVYVFDGRPPDLKQPLLARRAEASGVSRRTAAIGADSLQNSEKDCETLFRLLGVPCIQAPCEAEATCAALVASGIAWCTATEDMDALPFGSTRLVRNLKATKKCEVEEYSLPDILEKMQLNREQFVDLCILLGCDYTGKIRGLGPKKVLSLLQKHGSIEEILKHSDRQKHPVPDDWRYEEARALFLQPSVVDVSQVQLEWTEPDEEKLVQFLSHQKHIKAVRVRNRMENMRKAQLKKRKAQQEPQEQSPDKKQRLMKEFFPIKKASSQAKVFPEIGVLPPADIRSTDSGRRLIAQNFELRMKTEVSTPQSADGSQRSTHAGLPSAS